MAEAGQCHAAAEFLLSHVGSEPVRGELHAAVIASATLLSQLVWDASQRRIATARALRDRPKTRSLVLGNLALAYLRRRQLDAATLHEAIDVLEASRGGGAMTVVFSDARELYPWRAEPTVHDVHDRLLTLVASA